MAARSEKLSPIYLVIISVLIALTYGQRTCIVPEHMRGDWFSLQNGIDLDTIINENSLTNRLYNGECRELLLINNTASTQNGNHDAKILFQDTGSKCWKCYELYYRTPNILQSRQSGCSSYPNPTLGQVCGEILPQHEIMTHFRKDLKKVNCKTTLEGVFHFTYEIDVGGGSICDSPRSAIVACQEPGSPYVDNEIMMMVFGKCADVATSTNEKIRFQCMGTWRDESGNVFAAMANTGKDVWRERYRCLLTREDQQRTDNTRRYTMSRWARCNQLKSPYDGPYRLVMTPIIYGEQIVKPSCNLPRNYTGRWFTTGEYDTDVYVNSTHIYFKTKIDQFTYKETFFTCQQSRDTRYLMTAVTVGKCEVDYVCFDFLPRHHNVVRWRMGKPYRITEDERSETNFLSKKFRQACTWSSFTIDRNDIEWKYSTFILNPPAAIDCPIAGRYRFVQKGAEEEKYRTRIRGITERPRHMIDCREYETEFKVCSDNTKKILVDAEYCSTVDHTGRPIGEYDIADREMDCVGYWMEDMRSYMITYDEEDAVSKFRCWVYERLDWRNIIVSRATRAMCGKRQTSRSQTAAEGASLSMELYESERLFDECPQRFNEGRNPWRKESTIYILGGSSAVQSNLLMVVSLALFVGAWQYMESPSRT